MPPNRVKNMNYIPYDIVLIEKNPLRRLRKSIEGHYGKFYNNPIFYKVRET